MARPKIQIDPELVKKLALIGLSTKEASIILSSNLNKKQVEIMLLNRPRNHTQLRKRRIFIKHRQELIKIKKLRNRVLKSWKAHLAQMLVANINASNFESVFGYSLNTATLHLITQFPESVQSNEFHVDHIQPRRCFKLVAIGDPQVKKCFSLNNIRAISAIENLRKGGMWQDH